MIINLTDTEKSALTKIDKHDLENYIDKAVSEKCTSKLYKLPLSNCGTYVSRHLSSFERALNEYKGAKSAKKLERTLYDVRQAGRKLSDAVADMKHRMDEEIKDQELFYVDDHILWPHSFSENMSVRVAYKWRHSTQDKWEYGSIAFLHKHCPNHAIYTPTPRRKPSKRQQQEKLQEELARVWEHLRDLSLYAVRDFFRSGGKGDDIPERFQAVVDSYTSDLNNFSTQFWKA